MTVTKKVAKQGHLLEQMGFRIKEVRTQVGIGQRELARRSGLSVDAVHRLEHGHRNPSLLTVLAVAEALGVEPHVFLGGEVGEFTFSPAVHKLAAFLEGQPKEVVASTVRHAKDVAKLVKG